jgi:hypothetical protein
MATPTRRFSPPEMPRWEERCTSPPAQLREEGREGGRNGLETVTRRCILIMGRTQTAGKGMHPGSRARCHPFRSMTRARPPLPMRACSKWSIRRLSITDTARRCRSSIPTPGPSFSAAAISTLSPTVSVGVSRCSWSKNPNWLLTRFLCPALPPLPPSPRGTTSFPPSFPTTSTWPLALPRPLPSFPSLSDSRSSRVLFPLPEGPMIPTTCPGSALPSTPCKISRRVPSALPLGPVPTGAAKAGRRAATEDGGGAGTV